VSGKNLGLLELLILLNLLAARFRLRSYYKAVRNRVKVKLELLRTRDVLVC